MSLPADTGSVVPPGSDDAGDGQTTGTLTGTIRSTWVIAASTLDVFEQIRLTGTPPPAVPRSPTTYVTHAPRIVAATPIVSSFTPAMPLRGMTNRSR